MKKIFLLLGFALFALLVLPGKTLAASESAPEDIVSYVEQDQLKIQNTTREGIFRAWSTAKVLFSPRGVTFYPREKEGNFWHLKFSLTKVSGYKVPFAPPQASGTKVIYDRGVIQESYVNQADGIEQIFTLLSKDLLQKNGEIVVEGKFITPLAATHTADGVIFSSKGIDRFFYGNAVAMDTKGKTVTLPVELEGKTVRFTLSSDFLHDAEFPIIIDPLLTAIATQSDPTDQAFAYFGNSVATAGDVNGDLYSDVIVGAPNFDGTNSDEGRAYFFLGGANGISATPTTTLSAPSTPAGLRFGVSVSTAGDVNGDGYSDVIVGGDAFEVGLAGRAYVFHGSSSGLSSTSAWSFTGPSGSRFGISVATAGDVNGDGYSDVIVGANDYTGSVAGEGGAYIFHGSSSGLQTTQNVILEPTNQFDSRFGFSVATAGDVNGDGYSDVIVGAYFFTISAGNEGRTYIFHGSSTGVSGTAARTLNQSTIAGANFGFSVATAGDVNGDGYSDVIIGAGVDDGSVTGEGRAFVYHGSSTGIPATVSTTLEPTNQATSYFGVAVATAGDVNGDGYSDVIVGAQKINNQASLEGRAYAFLGSSSGISTTAAWSVDPTDQAAAEFGSAVATAGDIDADGFSDVIVGAFQFDGTSPTATDEGRMYIYRGSTDGLSTTADWTADPTNEASAQFANSVANAGDVNGDGYDDVIIGASRFDGGVTDQGQAYIFHGASTGIATSPSTTFGSSLPATGNWFGYSVASAGDVNGDGYSDVIVGEGLGDGSVTNEGRAYVYLGSSSGINTSNPAVLEPTNQANAFFGNSVASAGDVNGDGYLDIIIGAYAYDVVLNEGQAYVYYGSSSGISSTNFTVLSQNSSGATFGSAVTSAGDVNGDGYSDVIVGASLYTGSASGEGKAFVHHGSSSGISETAAWTVDPVDTINASFGTSVASGDVNGDGYSDVIVGAPYLSVSPTEGVIYVYNGSSGGLSTTATATRDPTDQTASQFGISVSSGDVNGDGISDVIIGASTFDTATSNEGRSYLYLGSASGISATPDWTVDPTDQVSAQFGNSVSSAGDVNGDGISDVVIGASLFNVDATTDEGRSYLYYGGGGRGPSIRPQQLRTNGSTPIQIRNASDAGTSFIAQLLGRTPAGRGSVRVEVEVKPNIQAFDGTSTTISSTSNIDVSGTSIPVTISGLMSGGTRYHWRARFRYNQSPVRYLGGQVSRWIYFGGNGSLETDLRTINTTPGSPTNLSQLSSLNLVAVYIGAEISSQASIVFRGTTTDDSSSSTAIRLQVEVKQIGQAFDGTGLLFSSFGSPGSILETSSTFSTGNYHWQARAEDERGLISSWTNFGGNSESETDFSIVLPSTVGVSKGVGGTSASASPPSLPPTAAITVTKEVTTKSVFQTVQSIQNSVLTAFSFFDGISVEDHKQILMGLLAGILLASLLSFLHVKQRDAVLKVTHAMIILFAIFGILIMNQPTARAVQPGEVLTYTVNIKNTGTKSISELQFIDELPKGVTFRPFAFQMNDSRVSNAGTDSLISLNIKNLNISEARKVVFSVTVRDDAPSLIRNTAIVTSNELTTPVLSNTVETPVGKKVEEKEKKPVKETIPPSQSEPTQEEPEETEAPEEQAEGEEEIPAEEPAEEPVVTATPAIPPSPPAQPVPPAASIIPTISVAAGPEPEVAPPPISPTDDIDQDGVSDTHEELVAEDTSGISIENGITDSDNDGLSDRLEALNNTNPFDNDSDDDGFTDSQEILEQNTDPTTVTPAAEAVTPQLSNISSGGVVPSSSIPFFGVAPSGRSIEVVIADSSGRQASLCKTQTTDNNRFLCVSEQNLRPGNYFVSVKLFQPEEISRTLSITVKGDEVFPVKAPTPKKLNAVPLPAIDLLKEVKFTVVKTKEQPYVKVSGVTSLGTLVFANWTSVLFTSAIIADVEGGQFDIQSPQELPVGDHRVTLYAKRPEDNTVSSAVQIAFAVTEEGGIVSIAEQPPAQRFQYWIIFFLAAILALIFFFWKRRLPPESDKL